MKLTGQSVPPELLEAYARSVSNNAPDEAGNSTARTRRAATQSQRKENARKLLELLYLIASFVARAIGHTPGTGTYNTFVYDEVRRILRQQWTPRYWTAQVLRDEQFLGSVPENAPATLPPPYAYRISDFLPSIVNYPDAVPASEPARVEGARVGDYWHDQLIVYTVKRFVLDSAISPGRLTPLLCDLQSTLRVTASVRPSRPMFSFMFDADLFGDDDDNPRILVPPVEDAVSFYWRYDAPEGDPPYYSGETQRRNSIDCVAGANIETEDDIVFCDLRIAPRPMLGYGFNNNTTARTEMDAHADLYQINPCLNAEPHCYAVSNSNKIWTIDPVSGIAEPQHEYSGAWRFAFNAPRILAWQPNGACWLANRAGAPLVNLVQRMPGALNCINATEHPLGFYIVFGLTTGIKAMTCDMGGQLHEIPPFTPPAYGPYWPGPATFTAANGEQLLSAEFQQITPTLARILFFVRRYFGEGQVWSEMTLPGNIVAVVPQLENLFCIRSDGMTYVFPYPILNTSGSGAQILPTPEITGEIPGTVQLTSPTKRGIYVVTIAGIAREYLPDLTYTELPGLSPPGENTSRATCYSAMWK